MNFVTRKKIAELIGEAKTIFSVRFIKRTTGEIRDINCMLGRRVKKGLTGGELKYDPKEKGLIMVYIMNGDENYEVDEKNRRSIPIDGIISAKIAGQEYTVI